MKLILTLVGTLLFISPSFGQSKEEILAEAYLLYNSEQASWHGTDIFLERFPEKKGDIGGYFSYSEGNFHSCLFVNKAEEPSVLAKITFDETFQIEAAKVDTTSRKLSALEQDLFEMRKIAIAEMSRDTMFKRYENINFNPIPIITEKEKKVFVLSGPQVSGVVIIGNDYLLTFDKKNRIKKKKALHRNIIPIEYDSETKEAVAFHSHSKSTGRLITSTDICTILLYGKYANWKQHIVMSAKNVSIWDCEKNELFIMKKKAWDRVGQDQQGKE